MTDLSYLEHRKRYGIREATDVELSMMTAEQLWHYNAAAHKPHGMHYTDFRYEGKCVRPLYLEPSGKIGNGSKNSNLAVLCPLSKETSNEKA